MKKRGVSIVMIIVLLAGILSVNVLAAGSLSNFSQTRPYEGQFNDVPSSQWYADEVQLVYEYGLIDGLTETSFKPDDNLTIAQAIKLAAVLHSIYNTGTSTFQNGDPDWYSTYVDYALENGIIASGYTNYNAPATRSDFALIFATAFPEEALSPINSIGADAVPDVSLSYSYGPSVYLLYRAGILTGDESHAFHPNSNIKRSEVAAIAARMANDSFRQSFSITSAAAELTATTIFNQCSPAIFYIEVSDASGEAYASGSGFFISSSGLAVTNFHVISGAASARILTTDGSFYDVAGVYDYSEDYDLALLQIDGTGFPVLTVGDSDTVMTGATVYAIGNPNGLINTISQGIVSNAARQVNDIAVSFIQFDAAISRGSSGGALINTYGQVVGVTSATFETGQNLNLAVPVNLIYELGTDDYKPLSTVESPTPTKYQITADPSNVTVAVGSQATVTVTDPSGNPDYVVASSISDKSVVSCTWGDFVDNYSCPLYIKGLKAGSTTVRVGLLDENDNILAETTVTVTVTGSNTTVSYYPGYYPAPDFGAYYNVEPVYEYYNSDDGSTTFLYSKIDITDVAHTVSIAMGSYRVLLIDEEFRFYDKFYDSDNNSVYINRNYTYGLDVYTSIAHIDGVEYVIVMVTSY